MNKFKIILGNTVATTAFIASLMILVVLATDTINNVLSLTHTL